MREGALYRNGMRVLPRVRRAERWWQRLRGLLFRPQLDSGEGLLLAPCSSIHTLGMHYALDIAFLDAEGHVLSCYTGVEPWRARGQRGAHETLELRAGGLARIGVVPGDRLHWVVNQSGDAA